MLCEECGERQAEVLVTTVVGGESVTRHLCRECLKKYQAGDLQAVLAAVLALMTQKEKQPEITCPTCGSIVPPDRDTCPHCGMAFSEFEKSGMLGCAECYQAFRAQLTPLITKVQGRAQHAGRRPRLSAEEQERQQKIEALRTQMEAAVAVENFEEAARLRDEIRAMEPAREAEA